MITLDPFVLAQAEELLKVVGSGDLVVSGALSAEPMHLTHALARRARDLDEVRFASGMMLSDYDFLDVPSIRFLTWFPPGTVGRRVIKPGRIDYLPASWAQVVDWLERRAKVDVALVQLTPADEDGWHSYGTSTSFVAAAARAATRVIAEINPQMIHTGGERIHTSELFASVAVDYPLPPFPTRDPDDVDRAVAEHVADLIPSGSVLQIGVGSIPDAALARLGEVGVCDLRIHSSASRGLLSLAKAGALAEGERTIRIGEVLGDQELYDFVANNPAVEMISADQSHYAQALARIESLVTLNSALSVDVYGQVNSEYVRGVHVGAVGGAADFVRAGSWPGNTSIIALRSTIMRTGGSRIVADLEAPTVSLSRDTTQFVVTEHGVADLRDKSVADRRHEIARVAHPDFRKDLVDG